MCMSYVDCIYMSLMLPIMSLFMIENGVDLARGMFTGVEDSLNTVQPQFCLKADIFYRSQLGPLLHVLV